MKQLQDFELLTLPEVRPKPDNLVRDARHGQRDLLSHLKLWSFLCHISVAVSAKAA